jgi:3',5'-cyclic AMP phosphodiesterase CpdA
MTPRLYAVSDLHTTYEQNRVVLERLRPASPDDWLIVAGDLGEVMADIERDLRLLARRFARVIWVPGNHELWTAPRDPVRSRGVERYRQLVAICRGLEVLTPEDPFPLWPAPTGPVRIAPLLVLYDYSFRQAGLQTRQQALEQALDRGIVCTDELLLHADPYEDITAWSAARLAYSQARLRSDFPGLPTVLVNHYPLIRAPTRSLLFPDFALWCGTEATADWHIRYNAIAMVYGHLHIPRTTMHDGVRFEEVSLGYPREWQRRGTQPDPMRQIMPPPEPAAPPPPERSGSLTDHLRGR